MTKSKRTAAELCQKLVGDRWRNTDIENTLREQMSAGQITAKEALERLKDHLVNDVAGRSNEACTHDGREVV
jgi:hypothetical protein